MTIQEVLFLIILVLALYLVVAGSFITIFLHWRKEDKRDQLRKNKSYLFSDRLLDKIGKQ
jgi:flagellar basal body-associated protein FliL